MPFNVFNFIILFLSFHGFILNSDLGFYNGFIDRCLIGKLETASQIDKGMGMYYIGEISNDFWNTICKNNNLQNTGDYVLCLFQWNGSNTHLNFSVGLLLSCRSENIMLVRFWDGNMSVQ